MDNPVPARKLALFPRISKSASRVAGRPAAFAAVLAFVVAWALTGPFYGFSDTWQLVINTTTTIVTFLMVFLIQATQNRDTEAIQLKLDELIRSLDGAHNSLIDLEELDEDELARIHRSYLALAERARMRIERGKTDTGVPPVDAGGEARP